MMMKTPSQPRGWRRRRMVGLAAAAAFVLVLALQHLAAVHGTAHSSVQQQWASGAAQGAAYYRALFDKWKFDTSVTWIDRYTLRESLLRIRMGPRRGSYWAQLDDIKFHDFDPRLTWTVFLHNVMHATNVSRVTSNNAISFPFSWYDWTDFKDVNKLRSLETTALSCSFIFESAFDRETVAKIESELGEPFFTFERSKYTQPIWYTRQRRDTSFHDSQRMVDHCAVTHHELNARYQGPFNVTKRYDRTRAEVFQLQARFFLLSNARNPLSISMVLNSSQTYQFNLIPNSNSNLLESQMVKQYILDQSWKAFESKTWWNKIWHTDKINYGLDLNDPRFDIEFNPIEMVDQFERNSTLNDFYKVKIEGTNKKLFDTDLLYLKSDDFKFDPIAKIKDLERRKSNTMLGISKHEEAYLESLRYSVTTHESTQKKYFYEGGQILQYKDGGHHRDGRFFNVADISSDQQEYDARMNALIRNWQKFTRANGLISWLAHGTLYSYMYNGQTFPWDNDFDLQMPLKHLNLLAQHFNQSLIIEDPREGNGRYLVDVTSSITIRSHGNGANNIDARFVDVDTGMYIDITGLGLSHEPPMADFNDYIEGAAKSLNIDLKKLDFAHTPKPDLKNLPKEQIWTLNLTNFQDFTELDTNNFDKNDKNKAADVLSNMLAGIDSGRFLYKGATQEQRMFLNEKFNLYNCRNAHFSSLSQLSPLVNTMYHGIPTLVPNMIYDSLRTEYPVPAEMDLTKYKDKSYLPELRHWFQHSDLEKYSNVNSWYPYLKSINSSVNYKRGDVFNMLTEEDLQVIFKNMVNAGNPNILAILYSSFETSSYRLKELEIQSAEYLTAEEMSTYLHVLRTEIGPQLKSPGKDPFLYIYEERLWQDLYRYADLSTLAQVQKAVYEQHATELWEATHDLIHKKLSLFNVTVPLTRLAYLANMNNLTTTIKSADGDKEQIALINIDLNNIGLDLKGAPGNWSMRPETKIFDIYPKYLRALAAKQGSRFPKSS